MEETEEDIVMVKVKRKTREKLKAKGKKGETYENVITQMLSALEVREVDT
jgi:DNA-directed RNA polymerase alpha subunit